MRTRTKADDGAEERIMEIVCFLLRRILEAPDEARSESDLIRGLEERGYGRSEISAAIELVLVVPQLISSAAEPSPHPAANTTRVFSPAEEIKLGLTVRGHLLKYREIGLLTEDECEEVLMHLLLVDEREVGLSEMQRAIRKVVGDEDRLLLLLPRAAQPVYTAIN